MSEINTSIAQEPDPVVEPDPRLVVPEREFTVKARSQGELIRRRFFQHKLAVISMIILGLVILLAFVGAALWKYSYSTPMPLTNRGRPTWDLIPWLDGDGLGLGNHPFGQDQIGRDYFALTMRGAQRSLIIAFVAGLLATVIGTIVGALAGFYRGWVDNVLMRFVDVALTIPLLLVAAVLGRRTQSLPILKDVFGANSIYLLALTIGLASWLSISRVVRGEFLSLREKEYVEAARALGTPNSRIIRRHLLPNAAGSIIVNATLLVSAAILIETALSYLGLGVRGSDWSLGKQVSEYQQAFKTRPWLFWYPGIFIIIIALTINFIGDGLRDAFDPKQTRVRQ
ncbi:MAG TPA: ABC transporter permease [Ilumatobacteraceae bacterium]|nr:ABC transporter permease [Ilumatobacteraceae bacterium]